MSVGESPNELTQDPWAKRLADAADEPWRTAEQARGRGIRVVGIFGRHAPRELVSGAGMLPVRLRAGALARTGAGDGVSGPRHVPEGLRGELSDEALDLLGMLLGGELHWIDALLIGRDSEAHLKLFYVIRELAQEPEYRSRIPPFAFSDVLRLPLRTSAVYNRLRLAELRETLAGWVAGATSGAVGTSPLAAGTDVPSSVADEALEAAISRECELAGQLREVDRLRVAQRVTGVEALAANRAAEVLAHAECSELLCEFTAAAAARRPLGRSPRVFVTGSEPDGSLYALLEELGLALVGDDHSRHGCLTIGTDYRDPIAWLADRYQFSSLGAGRAGLERVRDVSARVRETNAEAVLQIIAAEDEASGWELPELRALLPEVPVVSVEFRAGGTQEELSAQLKDAAAALRARVVDVAAAGGGHA